jgi:SAM-dependent methyltransferase
MSRITARTIIRETLRTLRRPRRILQVIKTDEVLTHLRRESIQDYVRQSWSGIDRDSGLRRRDYASYQDYLAHQRDKVTRIGKKKTADYDREYRAALLDRLREDNLLSPGMSVLCLAARWGTEVKSFHDLGCFAVGIDLNPGEDNRYVLPGDFHDVQFPDASVDMVFSNSLDHAFDLDKLVSEVRRVLKPDGLLIVEAGKGSDEGLAPGYYECCWWATTDHLVKCLENWGFHPTRRRPFKYPWAGEHLCFEARAVAANRPQSRPELVEICG